MLSYHTLVYNSTPLLNQVKFLSPPPYLWCWWGSLTVSPSPPHTSRQGVCCLPSCLLPFRSSIFPYWSGLEVWPGHWAEHRNARARAHTHTPRTHTRTWLLITWSNSRNKEKTLNLLQAGLEHYRMNLALIKISIPLFGMPWWNISRRVGPQVNVMLYLRRCSTFRKLVL